MIITIIIEWKKQTALKLEVRMDPLNVLAKFEIKITN